MHKVQDVKAISTPHHHYSPTKNVFWFFFKAGTLHHIFSFHHCVCWTLEVQFTAFIIIGNQFHSRLISLFCFKVQTLSSFVRWRTIINTVLTSLLSLSQSRSLAPHLMLFWNLNRNLVDSNFMGMHHLLLRSFSTCSCLWVWIFKEKRIVKFLSISHFHG